MGCQNTPELLPSIPPPAELFENSQLTLEPPFPQPPDQSDNFVFLEAIKKDNHLGEFLFC